MLLDVGMAAFVEENWLKQCNLTVDVPLRTGFPQRFSLQL